MNTFAALATVCFLLFAEAQSPFQSTTGCSCGCLPCGSTTPTSFMTTSKPANGTTSKPTTQMAATCIASPTYCNINTCIPMNSNTLCQYSTSTWGTACKPSYPANSTVSAADITTILTKHNSYRSRVALGLETSTYGGPQPNASNMRQMYWDNELACMAEAWARQCLYQNDKCRNVLRFQVGQNIYLDASSSNIFGTSNWGSAVDNWYSSVHFMSFDYVPAFPPNNPSIVSYTQVVWANTYLVGCATVYFQSTTIFPKNPYNRLYVCNYGPGGNVIGSPVYLQGQPGSACPTGTVSSSASGLCV